MAVERVSRDDEGQQAVHHHRACAMALRDKILEEGASACRWKSYDPPIGDIIGFDRTKVCWDWRALDLDHVSDV